MPKCKLCSNQFARAKLSPSGICAACHKLHQLPWRTEPRRPPLPCSRCHHRSFVRCHVLRERAASAGEFGQEYLAPLSATFRVATRRTNWAPRTVTIPDPSVPIGVFEAYICRGCGYTELYARDAASIPIGEEWGTELFEVPGAGPYR